MSYHGCATFCDACRFIYYKLLLHPSENMVLMQSLILGFTSRFKAGVENLQGIAGHVARVIFSAGRIYVLCVKS